MLTGMAKYLDPWSAMLIALTAILFLLALFVHGLTHDLLIEVGVLLVSAKLVIMSYKNSILGEQLHQSLEEIKRTLRRFEEPPSKK
jgi:protein-S-isoprenylcysteine O-methyltransferase Ste14